MVRVNDVTPAADGEPGGALQRIQRWLLTEVANELQQPGKLKLTVNMDESRQDIKAVIERFMELE